MDHKIKRKRTTNNAIKEDLEVVPLKLPKWDVKLDTLPKSKLIERCKNLQKELKDIKEKSDRDISSLKKQIVDLQVKQQTVADMESAQTQTYPQNDIDMNCGVCVAQYISEHQKFTNKFEM